MRTRARTKPARSDSPSSELTSRWTWHPTARRSVRARTSCAGPTGRWLGGATTDGCTAVRRLDGHGSRAAVGEVIRLPAARTPWRHAARKLLPRLCRTRHETPWPVPHLPIALTEEGLRTRSPNKVSGQGLRTPTGIGHMTQGWHPSVRTTMPPPRRQTPGRECSGGARSWAIRGGCDRARQGGQGPYRSGRGGAGYHGARRGRGGPGGAPRTHGDSGPAGRVATRRRAAAGRRVGTSGTRGAAARRLCDGR